ncbi:hypothetical protein DOY81_012845 [Sarcophaga bullata]|nr:hypothetical protein DOY81_012845 [Sarcophaga bullata]
MHLFTSDKNEKFCHYRRSGKGGKSVVEYYLKRPENWCEVNKVQTRETVGGQPLPEEPITMSLYLATQSVRS